MLFFQSVSEQQMHILSNWKNHALICSFRVWTTTFSTKRRSQYSTNNYLFSDAPNYRPAMLFRNCKKAIPERRISNQKRSKTGIPKSSKIVRYYADWHSEPLFFNTAKTMKMMVSHGTSQKMAHTQNRLQKYKIVFRIEHSLKNASAPKKWHRDFGHFV